MNPGIIIFPGINRERDMAIALEKSFGTKPRMVWHKDTDLSGLDLIVIPGGFSFGDYLRCGAMAARSPVMRAVHDHAARGGYILGICNGFQILTEAGILPGALLRNAGCVSWRWTVACGSSAPTPAFQAITSTGQTFRWSWLMATATTSRMTRPSIGWRARIWSPSAMPTRPGNVTPEANPNGSARSIAGILSPNLRVLGLMPHPEDLVDPLMGGTDGKPLFDALAAA